MPELNFQDYFAIIAAAVGVIMAALFSGHRKWRSVSALAIAVLIGSVILYFAWLRPHFAQREARRTIEAQEENQREALSASLQAALALENQSTRESALLRVIEKSGRAGLLEYGQTAMKHLGEDRKQDGLRAQIEGLLSSHKPKLCAKAVAKIDLLHNAEEREALRVQAVSKEGCLEG